MPVPSAAQVALADAAGAVMGSPVRERLGSWVSPNGRMQVRRRGRSEAVASGRMVSGVGVVAGQANATQEVAWPCYATVVLDGRVFICPRTVVRVGTVTLGWRGVSAGRRGGVTGVDLRAALLEGNTLTGPFLRGDSAQKFGA